MAFVVNTLVDGRCPRHGVLLEVDMACPACLDETNGPAVRRGELLRFSVELLRQIDAMPDHSSEVVRVTRITREPDGSATVYLERT